MQNGSKNGSAVIHIPFAARHFGIHGKGTGAVGIENDLNRHPQQIHAVHIHAIRNGNAVPGAKEGHTGHYIQRREGHFHVRGLIDHAGRESIRHIFNEIFIKLLG